MEKEEYPAYLNEFEEGVKDDVVMLGQISLEEVQEEEKRLRDEHIQWVISFKYWVVTWLRNARDYM